MVKKEFPVQVTYEEITEGLYNLIGSQLTNVVINPANREVTFFFEHKTGVSMRPVPDMLIQIFST